MCHQVHPQHPTRILSLYSSINKFRYFKETTLLLPWIFPAIGNDSWIDWGLYHINATQSFWYTTVAQQLFSPICSSQKQHGSTLMLVWTNCSAHILRIHNLQDPSALDGSFGNIHSSSVVINPCYNGTRVNSRTQCDSYWNRKPLQTSWWLLRSCLRPLITLKWKKPL